MSRGCQKGELYAQDQLRTYRLRTEGAATAYLPHCALHVKSLQKFGVETHGFFSAPAAPQNIVALISFDEDADPETVTQQYMQSDALKADMAGFNVSQVESVDTLLLVPGDGSPLG